MRYIMILSLCLVGFDGYAASETMAQYAAPSSPILVADFPFPMKGPEFAKILERGCITDGDSTWEVGGIYQYTNSMYMKLYENMPIPPEVPQMTKEEALARLRDCNDIGLGVSRACPNPYKKTERLVPEGLVDLFIIKDNRDYPPKDWSDCVNKEGSVYYYCTDSSCAYDEAFYVLFKLVNPAPTL